MDLQKIQMFKNRFQIAIDEKGQPKACGRDAARELIEIANEIEPNISHGDIHTGEMNVLTLILLKNKLENI